MLKDVLAGTICGLIMGTFSLGAIVFVLMTKRDMYQQLAKNLPSILSPTLVLLFLVFAMPPIWGVIGAAAGSLYNYAIDASPGSGLGSSNFTFTISILILTGLAMLPTILLIITRRKWGLLSLVLNLSFAGIFGWVLPFIANWR